MPRDRKGEDKTRVIPRSKRWNYIGGRILLGKVRNNLPTSRNCPLKILHKKLDTTRKRMVGDNGIVERVLDEVTNGFDFLKNLLIKIKGETK